MSIWAKLFHPSKHIAEIEDQAEVKSQYGYWRIRIMYAMFIGYAVYYFTRMTFAFAMPELKQLGFDEVKLGWIVTLFQLSYGVSKFASGIIADKSNPRFFMAFGLIITGILNVFFGLSSSLILFLVFWTLNGWFQGWGSAPCHRLLTHWYSNSERGRWWSLWNTAHNVGAMLIPVMSAVVIGIYGWRYSMYIPGVIAAMTGLFLINRLRDTPQSLGLPPIEKFHNDVSYNPGKKERELSYKEILVTHVLGNKFIWLLSLSYFLVYIIRWSIAHWSYHFLVDAQAFSHWQAAQCFVWFEGGGILGGLAAGWLSDIAFKGKRGPVNTLFIAMILPLILTFWYVSSTPALMSMTKLAMFGVGFFIYGPQMLLAVAAAELSHKKAAATATGFLGIVAYVGCSMTGGPLGHVIRDLGWNYFFSVIVACSILGTFCILPLWSVTKRSDKTSVSETCETA
ncbi:MAG: MFS transporter [Chlamydiota bacterium]